MARPLRIEYPGALYHITSRGNAKTAIFENDQDRKCFIDLLEDVVDRFNWRVHVYCLMDNHYHLLTETLEGNLSKGMRHLNGLYTQSFNRKYSRFGHVFQGRYKSIVIQRESYLLELSRYIVLNPVRAGIVKVVSQYPWSSYRATIGLEKAPECLTTDWILSQFGPQKTEAQEEYKNFVQAGFNTPSPLENLKGQCILGGKEFREKLLPSIKDKSAIKEITRVDRYALRPSLDELFNKTIGKKERNELIQRAYVEYGYSHSELGRYLGLHYSTISKIVKKAQTKTL